MLVYVRRLVLNDDDPEFEFIEATVVFHDDEKSPHRMAELTIFLQKDHKMTIHEIRAASIQKAREFLLFAANFPPSEYHQKWSYESTPEEAS
jgi:hypothetical protein